MTGKEPRVPTVDLPRVDAAQFQFFDHTVGAFLVTDDDALARWVEEFATRAPTTIATDIETRGLDTDKYAITAVTVAFTLGGDTVALLFDPLRRGQHRNLLSRVFDHSARIVFHGGSFDVAPLYAHRLMTRQHIRKVGDTLVAARMINTHTKAGRSLESLSSAYAVMGDDRTTMDTVFTARGLTKSNGFWFTDIDCPTYVVGALSDTVATRRLWGTPGVNGDGIVAAAARYLTHPDLRLGGLGVLAAEAAERVVEDVQHVNCIVMERTARGYAVDAEFPERFLAETAARTRAAGQLLAAAGVRPGNGADLVQALAAAGEIDPELWPRTPTGKLKADKVSLAVLDEMEGRENSPLVHAHQQVAQSEKVLKYVTKVVENAGPTGRLHPEIKILGASATGRMCLPEDQKLLTRRGVVAVDDIRVGDRTVGADGEWTTVRAVHRHRDAEVGVYRLTDGTRLRCTPEHCWVVRTAAGQTALATAGEIVPAYTLRLTPPEPERPHGDSCAVPPSTVHTVSAGATLMEEGRACHADEAGLLREAALLWVMDASVQDLQALLAGAGFLDGEHAVRGQVLADTWVDAFVFALYRLGVRSCIGDGRVELHGSSSPALQCRVGTVVEDVWCVTTDSGTLTAWDRSGPYLTGNSAAIPEIQQFPDAARGVILADDEDWVSADWKSIEPVILATASGDRDFIAQMRLGADPYEPVGQLAGIDRKLAKRKMLADMYGQGHAAAALQFGWDLDRAVYVARKIRAGLPILYRLIDALKRQSAATGHVTTLTGRVVDQRYWFVKDGVRFDEIKKSAAPNHFCQGSALDVMHHAILELDRHGLSDHVHLWMHDEVVADASIAEALTTVMATPPPFLEAVAAHHGMEAFLAVDLNEVGQQWKSV